MKYHEPLGNPQESELELDSEWLIGFMMNI